MGEPPKPPHPNLSAGEISATPLKFPASIFHVIQNPLFCVQRVTGLKHLLTGQTNMATTSVLPGNPSPAHSLSADIHAVPEPSTVQVDGEAAESVIAEKRIGERIKHLRL
jgi:hypothetical protein